MSARAVSAGGKFVSYLRVSTRVQGQSGLGLEAQRSDVQRFVDGSSGKLLREFVEVESGKRSDRPELQAALSYARRCGATLVVARLDRLSRNVAFLAALMESHVDFVACDNPHATRFTIHILAAVAEYEREMTSKRTKSALAAAKARGVALGSTRPGHWNGMEEKRKAGSERGAAHAASVHRQKADEAYRDVIPTIRRYCDDGCSQSEIARRLNDEGVPTRRGKKWHTTTVRLVIFRMTRKKA